MIGTNDANVVNSQDGDDDGVPTGKPTTASASQR